MNSLDFITYLKLEHLIENTSFYILYRRSYILDLRLTLAFRLLIIKK